MDVITSLTPEQELLISRIKAKWINIQSKPIDRAAAELAVKKLYALAGQASPEVVFMNSPKEACLFLFNASLGGSLWGSLWDSLWESLRESLWESLWESLGDSLGESLWDSLWESLWDSLWESLRGSLGESLRDSLAFGWHQTYMALYEAGAGMGVQFDQEKYQFFSDCCQNLDWVFPYEGFCIVCDRPQKVGWDELGQIHSETGPAVEFADGFKVWAIEGILVDEQVVLSPESQSIAQIEEEKNEEVKRIRLNRYGWHRYLEATEAIVLDVSVHQWMESLMRTKDGLVVLCTYDPSTGRPYALEVDPSCRTCAEAQKYLLSPEESMYRFGIDVSKIKTYPLVRS